MSASPRPADVHQIPDAGAGEGVSLQSLPDPEAEDRDRSRPVPDRAPDQDLVPEPADEAEEGAAGRQGDQRAGPPGPGDRAGQEAGTLENGRRRWRRRNAPAATAAAAAAATDVPPSDVARTAQAAADGRPGQGLRRHAQGQNVITA